MGMNTDGGRPPYLLYGAEPSLFTRKLEAALIFYRAGYVLIAKRGSPDAQLVETRAATHQIPVLKTPENWMIADTTPIIDMLDGRFPHRRLFPCGALGALTHIVEEHIDEWTARVMVHYRWHYPDSAAFVSMKIASHNEDEAAKIRQWGPRACRATGTETPFHQQAAEAEYERLLAAAEAQLATTRYLLGDRPTAVDCAVLGGLRAHILHDPDPRKVVMRFPRVVAWTERLADSWDGSGELAPFPASTGFARHVLTECADQYRPFLLANSEALAQGHKAFTVETYGETASYLARNYPEQSRAMVRERIALRLSPGERDEVETWLRAAGLDVCFAPAAAGVEASADASV
jgi:glutathione S-transferase